MAFPVFRHHIIFVSDQNVPEFLAAALSGSEKPCLHAIVSDRMLERSGALQKTWEKRGGGYIVHKLAKMEQRDIFGVLDGIREKAGSETLGLNITGGTKLMTLAAYDWASTYDIPAFYVDTAGNRIVIPGSHWEYESLPDILDVKTLISLYGCEILESRESAVNSEHRQCFRDMLEVIFGTEQGRKALGCLNGCAAGAVCSLEGRREAKSFRQLDELLALCARAGKLCLHGDRIIFAGEDARKWCNGIWLEEYVRSVLYQLCHENKIKSWACSARVRLQSGVENELDALFTARNRLHMLECKTSRLEESPGQPAGGKVSSILYKADSLHERLGGIYARSMICSIDPLPASHSDRAVALGIKVVSGKDLRNLKEHLLRWSSAA